MSVSNFFFYIFSESSQLMKVLKKMWLYELDITYILTPILHKGEKKYGVYIPGDLQKLPTFAICF